MRRPLHATVVDLNLAPMVDVMMCLLIFFMLATKMVERAHSAIDLPSARAINYADAGGRGERMVINIRPAPARGEDAEYVILEKVMTLKDVLDLVQRRRRALADLHCVIRADRGLVYGVVEPVLAGCADVGVRRVSFSAVPEGDDRS
jgi:biopolymer transport protein ExbD